MPAQCPQAVWDLILACTSPRPEERPTAKGVQQAATLSWRAHCVAVHVEDSALVVAWLLEGRPLRVGHLICVNAFRGGQSLGCPDPVRDTASASVL